MKQITSFMSDISDEFKIVVVHAIRSLCQKFPRKLLVLMTFLASMLRDEGGFEYKKAIVDTVIHIIEDNPEAKDVGLSHLCEFIEDCEHTSLAVRILCLLGREGPQGSTPSRYIRFMYNRLILENAPVRAAAVSALAKFGAHCDDLLPNILKPLGTRYILDGLQVSIVGLEKALQHYVAEPGDVPFDINSVPIATQPIEKKAQEAVPKGKPDKVAASRQDLYAEQLANIPELVALGLGPLFKSSPAVSLTESETEYVVKCIKHVYSRHIVLQFDCTNTLNDQILEHVRVAVEPAEGFHVIAEVSCPKLAYNVPGTAYVCLEMELEDPLLVAGTFSNTLKYLVKDCDPNTGEPDDDEGYEDEYVLEDLEVTVADHVQKVLKANFAASWEELGNDNQVEDTYALSTMKTLQDAVQQIIQFLGMQVCERSDKGIAQGVTMNLAVRSKDPDVCQVIISAVG
ncbi:hypothetical protein MRX96_005096 [Rhipicephalus microplus]